MTGNGEHTNYLDFVLPTLYEFVIFNHVYRLIFHDTSIFLSMVTGGWLEGNPPRINQLQLQAASCAPKALQDSGDQLMGRERIVFCGKPPCLTGWWFGT